MRYPILVAVVLLMRLPAAAEKEVPLKTDIPKEQYVGTPPYQLKIEAKGQTARYVRLYSNGNTANDMNHYVEVEVFGKPGAAVPLGAAGANAVRQPGVPPEGFTALFNGKDYTGWTGADRAGGNERVDWRDYWEIEDGVLRTRNSTKKGFCLWTTKSFKDFQVMIDFRFPKRCDSGLMLRGGPQVNLWCHAMGSGQLLNYCGRTNLPEKVRMNAVPRKNADRPSGQWNRMIATLAGDRLTVELNGETVIEGMQLVGIQTEGPIGLQKHGYLSCVAEFRNIFIREIGADEAAKFAARYERPAASDAPAPKEPGQNKPPEGFVPLFNGKDFGGWKGLQPPRGTPGQRPTAFSAKPSTDWEQFWKADGGVIRCDASDEQFGPHIWTEKDYGDFVLTLEYRFPNADRGNSGVFLRGVEVAQVDLSSEAYGSGCLLNYYTAYLTPEDTRKACLPAKKADRPIGQWNSMTVTVQGDRVTVFVNGEPVVDHAQVPQTKYFGVLPERGPIGLQKHGHGCHVEFRNVFIKELPSTTEE